MNSNIPRGMGIFATNWKNKTSTKGIPTAIDVSSNHRLSPVNQHSPTMMAMAGKTIPRYGTEK